MGSGKPNFDDCSLLRDGDISVWVPNTMGFLNDTVEIQLTGFLWNTNLVAISAKIDLMDRRSCGA